MIETIKLHNGVSMPMEGFGVFQIPEADCEQVVTEAIKTGYRLIDTASSYQNEEAVGRAIRNCVIPREELFITTKAYIQEMGYDRTIQAFERSLKKLGLDYLDLYLIHMPFGDYYGSWRAFEDLYREGKVRAIGVCNFLPEAWAPFAEGLKGMFREPVLEEIGKKYGKTPAQVILRWNVQQGVIVIPKSVHRERMEENLAIWDFELDAEDMEHISRLDKNCPSMLDTRKVSEVRRVYDYLEHPVLTSL